MRNTFTWVSGVALATVGVLAGPAAWAQTPAWQSAISLGETDTGYSEVRTTAVDANGNVYVAGDFSGTINIGATTLTAGAGEGVFVAKWSSASRSFVWAQRAGGAISDYVEAIAVSGNSVYIAGGFRSLTADFGSFNLVNANQDASAFSGDLFIAKLTDAGASASFTWAQRAGGTQGEAVNDLVVAGNSLYIAGGSTSASFQLGNTTLTNVGKYSAFVAKLTDAGTAATVTWAQGAAGTGGSSFDKLVVDGATVVVAGDLEGTVSFGTPATTITSAGDYDMLVAKLTDLGSSAQYVWAQSAGGTKSDFVRGLAKNGNNIYVAGDFSSPTSSFGNVTLQNTGGTTGNDAFVAKLTDAGATASFTWAQKAGGTDYDECNALLVRGSSVYIAGNFTSSTAAFGALSLTNSGAARSSDIFVARLQDAGNTSSFVWAQRGGSAGNDYCRSLTSGGNTVYVGGSVHLPASFGSQTLPGASTSIVGFWATITDATGLAATAPSALAELTLAPNPAHEATEVLIPADSPTAKATLTLLDAVGRVVRTQAAQTGHTLTFDLAGVAPGLYLLRVQAGEALAVRRLVVR